MLNWKWHTFYSFFMMFSFVCPLRTFLPLLFSSLCVLHPSFTCSFVCVCPFPFLYTYLFSVCVCVCVCPFILHPNLALLHHQHHLGTPQPPRITIMSSRHLSHTLLAPHLLILPVIETFLNEQHLHFFFFPRHNQQKIQSNNTSEKHPRRGHEIRQAGGVKEVIGGR